MRTVRQGAIVLQSGVVLEIGILNRKNIVDFRALVRVQIRKIRKNIKEPVPRHEKHVVKFFRVFVLHYLKIEFINIEMCWISSAHRLCSIK
jgi:hypothetical protein